MKKILFFILTTLIVKVIPAQSLVKKKVVEKKVIQEEYYVLKRNPSVRHGEYKAYFSSGKLKKKGMYNMNVPDENWSFYYESGSVKATYEYKEGDSVVSTLYYEMDSIKKKTGLIVNGEKEGFWQYFYENGEIKREGIYKNGEEVGEWKQYNESGLVKSTTSYIKPNFAYYTEYYENKKLKTEGYIKNGYSDSTWKEYDENGILSGVGSEKNGLKNGVWTYFYPDSVKEKQGSYHNGEPYGTWKFFHQNGKIKFDGSFHNGQKQGRWTEHSITGGEIAETNYLNGDGEINIKYESGNLRATGFLKDEKFTGEWLFYSKKGELLHTCDFNNDTGTCIEYFKGTDSIVKSTGTKIRDKEVGKWIVYKKNGDIQADIFHEHHQNESTDTTSSNHQSQEDTSTTKSEKNIKQKGNKAGKPEKHRKSWRERKKNWWNKLHAVEEKGIIIETNPLSMLIRTLPVSLEYYIHPRIGLQGRATLYRYPFKFNQEGLGDEQLGFSGFSFDFEQKLYTFKSKQQGSVSRSDKVLQYWGQELRYTNVNYFMNADTDSNGVAERFSVKRQSIELSMLLGGRLLGDSHQSGFTMEVFIGFGVGWNFRSQNFEEGEEPNVAFDAVPKNNFFIPAPRFGVMAGYYF